MKKYSLFLLVIFLFSTGSIFQQVNAQEKTKEEKQKEEKMQQKIEQQKKEMTEKQRVRVELDQSLKEQQEDINNSIMELQDESERGNRDRVKIVRTPGWNRSFNMDEPFVFSGDNFYGHSMFGDNERSSWEFSKSVKDNTFSGDYTFEVEKTSKSVVMSVTGDCKSGEIRIKIVMPNGKNYSDIVIDESGSLNWRKSFAISETENQDKAGNWKFQISSANATGFFKISLQSY